MKVYSSVTEMIGRTPLLELKEYQRMNGLRAQILAKLESFNPSGSLKDRTALAMVAAAASLPLRPFSRERTAALTAA